MKTTGTIMTAIIAVLFLTTGNVFAQVDLLPGINYAYNPPGANGIITGVTVDACNNGASAASACDVTIYLYDPGNGNHWNIGTTRLNNGLSGNACITISNWDIDINSTPNIPAGNSYRIGTWIDSGSEVTESDENNNAGLMSGTISYTPNPNAAVELKSDKIAFVNAVPNPSNGDCSFNFSVVADGVVSLKILDITGKEVAVILNETLLKGIYTYLFKASSLEAGIYFYTLTTNEEKITQRLVVSK